ncbi:phosphotransferase family protein [Mucisphaera sp.]|uniref:phosphotransferase family protein n=1 Tax=Mucisphaera sp. TaxID=2913024 RepID=UPI003D131340
MTESPDASDNEQARLAAEAAQNPAGVSGMDWRPLGSELGQRLIDQCEHRLRDLAWFRTDWQRGGALTGYANWVEPDCDPVPVVVKLPVPPRERLWMRRLQRYSDIAPRLYADGDMVGGYDLAWVIMERLEHGPLGSSWGGAEFDLLIESAARFYVATYDIEVAASQVEPERDWLDLLERARKKVRDGAIPEADRWKAALKASRKQVETWGATWAERPAAGWCHGDLHLGNAMTRQPAPEGPALLFDYARVHPGHWLRDAIYFEHLYWAAPDHLGGRKLCNQLAKELRSKGFEVDEQWSEWAEAYRALTAMVVPLRLKEEGNPAYVHAALELLERRV